jgi:hypothetical protein
MAMSTLQDLLNSLLDFLMERAADGTADIPTLQDEDNNNYAGILFDFPYETDGQRTITAIMIDIDRLHEKIGRYTSQKARFIQIQVGEKQTGTHTDLYRFSPDEKELFLKFLREGSDRLFIEAFHQYIKEFQGKGYLFNESMPIIDIVVEDLAVKTFIKNDVIKVRDKIYLALKDVPVSTEPTDKDYWKEVSHLYDTRNKVVFFIASDSENTSEIHNGNILTAILRSAVHYLYAYVLHKWYGMVWYGYDRL